MKLNDHKPLEPPEKYSSKCQVYIKLQYSNNQDRVVTRSKRLAQYPVRI